MNLATNFKLFKHLIVIPTLIIFYSCSTENQDQSVRERISINSDWKFYKYESHADSLIYDIRPKTDNAQELRVADAKPTEAVTINQKETVLKPWILPTGNDFIKDSTKHFTRPEGNPGENFAFVKHDFDDANWKNVNLPHDWAIDGPFQTGWDSEVGGGMGRLPVNGVGWYRKKLDLTSSESNKNIFLDIDGAMSHAMVWVNGQLAGGWPYGYNSFRINLTPYLKFDETNQLAIRIDNPNNSARWYPGGGIYRNVWLTITNPVHVAHWGTFVTTEKVSKNSATINLEVNIDNNSRENKEIEVVTDIYELHADGIKPGSSVASFEPLKINVSANGSSKLTSSVVIKNPNLWGPPPTQKPHLYLAQTKIIDDNKIIDTYETRFGIRTVEYDANKGVLINGEHIILKGVNNHHDLGALGAAFNTRAAERQLEILAEMGCNAIRMAHNPPAPELLELTDKMGFLVVDEVFDSWERKKTPLDFHLIFPEWHEQDARSMVRRDKNCPSVIMWSFGNEVGEQYTDKDGAAIGAKLVEIIKDEDPTRLTTASMNFAKPHMPFPGMMDIISLNYQGEGIRQEPEFEGTERIRTAPQYNLFHERFPDKVIVSSETASAFSSRGVYYFPVTNKISSPTRDGRGGNSEESQVSSYELYCVDFGSSPDRVFRSLDQHPFVAGEFVWTGFDYIGEPTPYYNARSSYTGIVDLAGFKKDRFYLYQSRWRPDFPMVHILPHWNWPDRIEEITPVHVFTSGDEVELFLNGESLGRKQKDEYEYRLRWDSVKYQPGELKAVAYKGGEPWAEKILTTTGGAEKLMLTADRIKIIADGYDLSFITVQILDNNGQLVPRSNNEIHFEIEGPGEIVATDNGDPTDMVAFPSHSRKAFNGLALVIVRSQLNKTGEITITSNSEGLESDVLKIISIQ